VSIRRCVLGVRRVSNRPGALTRSHIGTSGYHTIPPPKINRSIPKKMTTMHMVFPLLEFTMLLIIKPTTAMGMTIQFNQPNKGMKATSIANRQTTPKRNPIALILLFDY
jgi:hypothetical protein